jgi:SAM-dependent methyltransferase
VPGGSPDTTSVPVLTGERTWPGIPEETYWFTRHLACYRWAAAELGSGLDDYSVILDAGSGEGYGCRVLSELACDRIVGTDLDPSTVLHLATRYPGIAGVVANLVALPYRDGAFGAAVSFQVLEHMWDPRTYLRELHRCSSGPIVLSTPNRPVHSPDLRSGEKPTNPFHVREFDIDELRQLLTSAVPERSASLFGLRHGDRISKWESENGSLPQLLMSPAIPDRAAEFAAHARVDDFEVVAIEDDTSGVLDLIATW